MNETSDSTYAEDIPGMRLILTNGVVAAVMIPVLFALTMPRRGKDAADTSVQVPIPPHPRGYVCYRTSGPITVDGRLNESSWQAVPWSEPFVDIEGYAKPTPRFRTRMKMLWDDEYFYVGAELEEPHVWATLTQHDAVIFHDNDFEVFIDPDGDSHEYYEFEINALNTGWDLLLPRPYKDGGRPVDSWEIPGLKTAVHVDGTLNDPRDTDRGWTVELAFPWKVLTELASPRERPKDGDQWRTNFSRVEWKHEIIDGKYKRVPNMKEDNWVWSPQEVVDMHRPETWGYVQFSSAPVGTADFCPDPAWEARSVLHAIYYSQREYRKQHGAWARTLAQLGLAGIHAKSLAAEPRLETTRDLFQVSVVLSNSQQRWHIRQDARVWKD
jgi:hypothetical protein